MKQLFALLVFCLGSCLVVKAQQNPYLRFYNNNWQFINPAAMDRHMMKWRSRNYSMGSIQTRQQWVGFEGAPLTILASGEFKKSISPNARGGPRWGGTVYYDKTDAFSTMGVQGNYAYVLEMPNVENRFLHIGLSFGIQNQNLNTAGILPTLVDPTDPSILNFQRRTLIDFGAGIMYQAPQQFYLGFSAPQMVRAFAWRQGENSGLYGKQAEQYCFMGGWFIHLSDPYSRKFDQSGEVNLNETETRFVLEPSMWVRFTPTIEYINWFGDRSPVSCDLNVRLYGWDRFWAGLGAGSNGNASIEFGTQFKIENSNKRGVRAGVTSSFPFLGRNPALGTSVELFVSYFLRYK